MNSLQEAKLNMYQALKTHCDGSAAVIPMIPAFQTVFNDFKAQIAVVAQQKSTDVRRRHGGEYTLRVKMTGFQDFEDDEVEVKMGVVNHRDVKLISS
jgi:hypothetical protein